MSRKSVDIARALEKEILGGQFPPGHVINEVALATRFGVSRTPVREALLSLASSGLVELEAGRGAVVVGVSLEKVFDSYEVLAELLGYAACLAAQRMTALGKAQLQSIHDEMSRHLGSEDRDIYVRLDAQFHDAVLAGCANQVLARHIGECKKTIAAVRHASMESHPTLDRMYAEHDRIVRAITAGDADAARHAMRDHVQLRGDGASKLVAAWQKQRDESAA